MLLSLEDIVVRWEQVPNGLGDNHFALRPFRSKSSFTTVLDKLSLQVDEGDFLVVLGPSGSGKTTLLKTLAGLIRPESGSILHRGSDISRLAPHRRSLSLVLQNGGWYDHLTVEKNLELDGASRHDVSDAVDRFGLSDFRSRLPSQLSGGQTQRLAIARAWLRKHDLILFDEPLSQLDYHARESLREVIKQLHRAGKTVVYVTHDQYDAAMLADKIAVLHAGKVQQCDTPENIYRRPNHRVVAESLGQPPMQFFDVGTSPAFEMAFRSCFGASRDPAGVVLGIRPEAWKIVDPPTHDTSRHSIRLSATFVERRSVGPQRLETWTVEDISSSTHSIMRFSENGDGPTRANSPMTLDVAIDSLCFFERSSGNRL